MTKLRLYQVDAFSSRLFGGNPAAVVPLVSWLDDDLMQDIAAENNLAETAFFVPAGERYELRWFTPMTEVELCGHATLASAHVLFTAIEPARSEVLFETRSGPLGVVREEDKLRMDFPRWTLRVLEDPPAGLEEALGIEPQEVLSTSSDDNFFAMFDSESEVRSLEPDMDRLAALHPAGVVATARGTRSDCVCRYFAPSYGVDEDSGTGSIHCGLTPLWCERLGRTRIHSIQVSKRGAELFCELREARTLIAGRAVTYLEGWITL
jgi:PhzF family phenazine biosynthesis protein